MSREEAVDTVALCKHHVSSCGEAAACTDCIATALSRARKVALEEAAKLMEATGKRIAANDIRAVAKLEAACTLSQQEDGKDGR